MDRVVNGSTLDLFSTILLKSRVNPALNQVMTLCEASLKKQALNSREKKLEKSPLTAKTQDQCCSTHINVCHSPVLRNKKDLFAKFRLLSKKKKNLFSKFPFLKKKKKKKKKKK